VIWLALVALACVGGGAWFIAKSMRTRVIVLVAGLAAVGGYWVIGHPGMADEPLAGRLDELEKQAQTGAASMTADQLMALIQKRGLEKPNDPEPHKYMGDLLEATGRPQDAILAYQSALRRNPDFLPAIVALADLLFKMSADVEPATGPLYQRAHELNPSDQRITFMAGIGAWKEGRKDEAEALWAEAESKTPADDPKQGMYRALREMFTKPAAESGDAPAAPAAPAPGAPAKTP
jgi:cytochrome c-type biogenesis protein CcmH/NrfG